VSRQKYNKSNITFNEVSAAAQYGKDKFDNIFTVAENIMFDKPTHT
jgi:hypothetical protein